MTTGTDQQVMDAASLWKAVQETAGVELSEVPILAKYLWFPTPQSGGIAPTIIEMGENEIPVKPGYVVFAMFQDTDEVRVYALATTVTDKAGKPNPATRLTLSKHQAIIGVEIMALDVFIEEVANELEMLAPDEGPDEEEEEEEDEEGEGEEGEDEPEPDAVTPNGGGGGSPTAAA